MTATAINSSVYQDYITFLKQFSTLSEKAERSILDRVEIVKGKKGEMILTEDEPCKYLYYIHTGAAHMYFRRADKRVTTWLCLDNDIVTSVENVTDPYSVKRNIELLEDSVIVKLSFADLNQLYKEFHEIETLGRLLTSHYFAVMNQKMHRNYFLTAKERYDRLLDEYPEVAWRIPLGIVANYLGINQATLSRIRRPDYQGK